MVASGHLVLLSCPLPGPRPAPPHMNHSPTFLPRTPAPHIAASALPFRGSSSTHAVIATANAAICTTATTTNSSTTTPTRQLALPVAALGAGQGSRSRSRSGTSLLVVCAAGRRGPVGGRGGSGAALGANGGDGGGRSGSGSAGGRNGPLVVVVESPTKAKKIQAFLGPDYKVLASYGHIRDLPPHIGSVRPEADFEMCWSPTNGSGPRLSELAAAAASARGVLLATDPDREGEAIAWHITEELQRLGVLSVSVAVQRISFTEITQGAVTAALSNGRQVSRSLVDAYLARRALDFLVGFHLSPVLWRRLQGARSAGRVQSVALRLVVEREEAVQAFRSVPYWSLQVQVRTPAPPSPPPLRPRPDLPTLSARLVAVEGVRLGAQALGSERQAEELAERIRSGGPAVVSRVAVRTTQRHPPPPFTTASLQQEAARRLGFTAARTMRVAQQLYEGAGSGEGLITYMRTDGLQMSNEAVAELRAAGEALYGKGAVHPQPRQYKSRAKNAQEAHEAIRPTHPRSMPPAALPADLDPDQRALYELIWRRAMACQMSSAVYEVVGVDLAADGGRLQLRASGSAFRDSGFLRAYADKDDDDEEQEGPGGNIGDADEATGALARDNQGQAAQQLLTLKEGDSLDPCRVASTRHTTRPPPRFTEASLVRALEEAGVGRPSTYAPIMAVLQDRGYVVREGRSLVPTPLGRVLVVFLRTYFGGLVDVGFTMEMEGQLDEIAGGRAAWRQVLSDFWDPFTASVAAMKSIRTTQVYDMLDKELEPYLFPRAANPSSDAFAVSTAAAAGPIIDLTPNAVHTPTEQMAPTTETVNDADSVGATAATATDPRLCPKCRRGRLVLKPSRFGGFIGCSLFADPTVECNFTRPFLPVVPLTPVAAGTDGSVDGASSDVTLIDDEHGDGSGLESGVSYGSVWGTAAAATERLLGRHPESGEAVWARLGPYGLYVQLGDETTRPAGRSGKKKKKGKEGKKARKGKGKALEEVTAEAVKEMEEEVAPPPRRAAVPKSKGLTLHTVDLPTALSLLALPRSLGPHPTDGQPVTVAGGPFGPYVAHNGVSASLGRRAGPQDVDLSTAVALLEAKRVRLAARQAAGLPLTRGLRGRKGTATGGAGSSRRTVAVEGAHSVVAAAGEAASGGKSGYTRFLSQRWAAIRAADPQAVYREAVRDIAAAWRGMGLQGQRDWVGQAAERGSGSGSAGVEAQPAGWGESMDEDEGGRTLKTKERKTTGKATGKAIKVTSKVGTKGMKKAGKRATMTVAAAAAAVRGGGGGSDLEDDGDSSRGSAVQKRRNPFLTFCAAMRPELRATHPDATVGQQAQMLGAAWRGLSEEERAVYQ